MVAMTVRVDSWRTRFVNQSQKILGMTARGPCSTASRCARVRSPVVLAYDEVAASTRGFRCFCRRAEPTCSPDAT